jgi:hypothetical protein
MGVVTTSDVAGDVLCDEGRPAPFQSVRASHCLPSCRLAHEMEPIHALRV